MPPTIPYKTRPISTSTATEPKALPHSATDQPAPSLLDSKIATMLLRLQVPRLLPLPVPIIKSTTISSVSASASSDITSREATVLLMAIPLPLAVRIRSTRMEDAPALRDSSSLGQLATSALLTPPMSSPRSRAPASLATLLSMEPAHFLTLRQPQLQCQRHPPARSTNSWSTTSASASPTSTSSRESAPTAWPPTTTTLSPPSAGPLAQPTRFWTSTP